MLPVKFVIVDTEYGDEDVAAKQGKFSCLFSVAAVVVENLEIQRQLSYLIKPLYPDQLTPKIMGITGLTPQHFDDASTAYEPVREVMSLMRNQFVFSWGHIDSIKLRYWASVFDIKYPFFKAVDAYSYLLAHDEDTKPRMRDEAARRGLSSGNHHEALADCLTVLRILTDHEDRLYEAQEELIL